VVAYLKIIKYHFFFIIILSNATFQCGSYNVKNILKKYLFANENMKKTPQKIAYFSRNSVVSEIFHLLPTVVPNSPNGRIHVPKCGL
jgi:hypothetical protein